MALTVTLSMERRSTSVDTSLHLLHRKSRLKYSPVALAGRSCKMLRFSFSFGSLHLKKWQTPQMHALTASVAAMSGKWVLFPTST